MSGRPPPPVAIATPGGFVAGATRPAVASAALAGAPPRAVATSRSGVPTDPCGASIVVTLAAVAAASMALSTMAATSTALADPKVEPTTAASTALAVASAVGDAAAVDSGGGGGSGGYGSGGGAGGGTFPASAVSAGFPPLLPVAAGR